MRISPGLHPNDLPARGARNTYAHRRVLRSRQRILIFQRLGIGSKIRIGNLGDDLTPWRAEVVNQCVLLQARSIELPEGDGVAVGTPCKTVTDIELLFIHPV